MTFFLFCLSKSSKTTLLTSDLLYKEIFGVSKNQDLKISETNIFYKLLKNNKNLIKIYASPAQIKLAKTYGGIIGKIYYIIF